MKQDELYAAIVERVGDFPELDDFTKEEFAARIAGQEILYDLIKTAYNLTSEVEFKKAVKLVKLEVQFFGEGKQ